MISCVMALCRLADVRKLVWCVEQPTSSLAEHHDRFQARIAAPRHSSCLHVFCKTFALVGFGGQSPKPVKIWSSRAWILLLRQTTSPALIHHRRKNVLTTQVWDPFWQKYKVTGKRKEMSVSEAYPLGFGRGIARRFRERYVRKCRVKCNHSTRGLPLDIFSMVSADAWADAGVPAILAFFKGCAGDSVG